jgi:hypothetical protein
VRKTLIISTTYLQHGDSGKRRVNTSLPNASIRMDTCCSKIRSRILQGKESTPHVPVMEHVARVSAVDAETSDRDRPQVRVKRRPRSAVTSGRKAFIAGDPNSAWARRFHDLVVRHVGDLGGRDVLSEAQFSLIRRATSIECELERMDALLSTGVEVDLDSYGRAASHLRRLFETLGIGRKARDVTHDGVEIEPPFSPMRARWQAEAAAAAKQEGAE